MPAGPVLRAPRGVYGGGRIVAGARFLVRLDPGWWREDAFLPASLAALDMADPHRCVLAWWAARHLLAPAPGGTRQVSPYDRARLALCLSSPRADALGFTGADADLLTPGWRHLIKYLRASYGRRTAVHPARRPGWPQLPRKANGAWAGHEGGSSWQPMRWMYMDCPAYLDAGGLARCGLPAEIQDPYLVQSTDGPLESARIRCPRGHCFNGPIESLTRHRNQTPAVTAPGSADESRDLSGSGLTRARTSRSGRGHG